ncbi:MAG: acyl-CoA dehydrogenase, partial [Flavobacteriales bacterium]
ILLRVEKLISIKGEGACQEQIAMVKAFFYEASDRINKSAKDALNSFAEGDELKMMLMGLKRFTKHEPFNIKDAYQQIAIKVIEKNEYCY